jgi:N-acetylglucosaminyldiphosphoundecaprenol N-acetyl-beta-D-mannosaminyltransferase
LRLTDPAFRATTDGVEYFVPDSTPLTWCVNAAAGSRSMADRVYGPRFMAHCLAESPPEVRHFFLGASKECLEDLMKAVRSRNPQLNIVGSQHGYFSQAEWPAVAAAISAAAPHLIWVGLGTPKQQAYTAWIKERLPQGWLLNVGFAFDVNAGWKQDAPRWMQSLGLTWLFRLLSEPGRMAPRYSRYNSLFLLYAADWFLSERGLPWLRKRSGAVWAVALAGAGVFLIWFSQGYPGSLLYLGTQVACLGLAWVGTRYARVARRGTLEPFAPGKALLRLAVWASWAGACAHALALPLVASLSHGLLPTTAAALIALSAGPVLLDSLRRLVRRFPRGRTENAPNRPENGKHPG